MTSVPTVLPANGLNDGIGATGGAAVLPSTGLTWICDPDISNPLRMAVILAEHMG